MPLNRKLAWIDTWIEQIQEDVTEAIDPDSLATFPDQTTPQRLVTNWNQAQYTRILSALNVGSELVYPLQSQQIYYDFLKLTNSETTPEDFCEDITLDTISIIQFEPQDPFLEPDLVPDGYLMPPFWRVGGLVPEFLPDWFQDLIADIIDQFTGYESNDILTTIGSFPLFANWDEILTNGLPRFTVTLEGSGTLELHFLNVPFGGRALVSVDVEFDIADIIDGILTEGFKLVELERDYSSIPPELDVDNIEEIVLTGSGEHVIYVTFLPVVDVTAFPLKFGGGIRKINWCPDEIPDEECPECPEPTIAEIIADDEYFVSEYVPIVFGEYYSATQTEYETLLAAHDDTPQSVAPDVPVAAPDDADKNALCYATNRFVELYSSQKTCLIQSQNFIESLLSDMANAANDFYNTATSLILPFYSPNIFSCFVDDTAAIAALSDAAAIEELACFIYDELKTVAMSQANFDAAILDAATTLTGNAQDIACIMQNDSNESLYISFLQGYNIAINRVLDGESLECPCEAATYRLWKWDFANGMGDFQVDSRGGAYAGGRVQGTGGNDSKQAGLIMPMNPAWRVRAVRLNGERNHATAQGNNDIDARFRPTPNSDTGSTFYGFGQYQLSGTWMRCATAPVAYHTGFNQMSMFLRITKTGASPAAQIYLDTVEILFVDGYHKGGYLTADSDPCT